MLIIISVTVSISINRITSSILLVELLFLGAGCTEALSSVNPNSRT